MGSNFKHTGLYKCECGKEFTNSQSFNGHKTHCKEYHLIKYGNLDKYAANLDVSRFGSKCAIKARKEKSKELNEIKLSNWLLEKHTCEKCGKVMTIKYGSGRFCSSECAHSREQTDEIRLAKSLAQKGKSKKSSVVYKCIICGKVLRHATKTGMCRECYNKSDSKKEATRKCVEHRDQSKCSWKSRNITSYPEQFWIKVLNNNSIKFIRELPVKKLDGHNYFLDFYIEVGDIKLDLEIDGRQHNDQDRKESDIERDNYLNSLGYTVYRIDWNEINSQEGSDKMKLKIDLFLEYYRSLSGVAIAY